MLPAMQNSACAGLRHGLALRRAAVLTTRSRAVQHHRRFPTFLCANDVGPHTHRYATVSSNTISFLLQAPHPLGRPKSQNRLATLVRAQDDHAQAQDGFFSRMPRWSRKIGRPVRKLAKWLLGFAAFAALVVALLPTILSTGLGLSAGTALINKFTPGVIHIEKADLGWTKPIRLKGITVQSPPILGGDTLAKLPSLSTTDRLLSIAMGQGFDAFAPSPWIDCSLAPSGQLKWTQLLNYETGRAAVSVSKGVPKLSSDGARRSPQDAALVGETAEVAFTAEGRLLTGSLYMSGGTLRIPQEVKEVVGRDLHAVAVVGAGNVREAADEFSLPTAWLDSKELPANPQGPSTTGSGKPSKAATADRDATIIAVRSEHLDIEVSGWQQPDGRLRLRQPAKAELQFTPALAKHGLSRVSPLLSGILAVDEGKVQVELVTSDMHMPSESYSVRIDPLRVAVSRQGLLASVIEFLRLKESKDVAHKSLLQGATGAIHVNIDDKGSVTSKRLDLLISSGGKSKGVHMCTWGKIDPVTSSMDLALGIPSDTLSMIGLKGLEGGEMLVVPLKGSAMSPRVDWAKAYKRLAALAASSKREPRTLQGQILQGIVQGLDLRANAPGLALPDEVPQPIEPLPWHQDSNVLQDTVKVDKTTVKDPSESPKPQ